MKGLNQVSIIGTLGQDPELRYTGSGTAVCNLRVATDESYKDDAGTWQDKTEWHNIVCWGRLAEICNEYLKKGSRAFFQGSLQTRSYEDKEGNRRYSTEVKARDMMLLDRKGDVGGDGASRPAAPAKAQPRDEYQQAVDHGLPF